jgi:hypothetical protein
LKIIIFIALAFTAGASANDTFATLTTTGLVFAKSSEITMESEDLYISPVETRVKYVFKNESANPVTSIMAFPLPSVPMHTNMAHMFVTSEPDAPVKLAENPLKFEVKVDGKKVPFKTEVKTNQAQYLVDVKYYWEQTFPSGKRITIEHKYLTTPGSGKPEGTDKLYCFDQVEKQGPKSKEDNLIGNGIPTVKFKNGVYPIDEHFTSRHISYVLTTAANWRGPIKKFKMTLDKLDKENYLATCWEDLKKISDTQYVSEKTDFTPTKDLKVYVNDLNYFKR